MFEIVTRTAWGLAWSFLAYCCFHAVWKFGGWQGYILYLAMLVFIWLALLSLEGI